MLKLTILTVPDLYAPVVNHPRVARVVALSGGCIRDEACVELKRSRGIIANFSRALLPELRADMSDDIQSVPITRSLYPPPSHKKAVPAPPAIQEFA